jgi:hypothetical protein
MTANFEVVESAAGGAAAAGGILDISWLADFSATWFWKSLKPARHKASFHGTPCTGGWMQENRFVSSCMVCCKPSAVAAAMGLFYMAYQQQHSA